MMFFEGKRGSPKPKVGIGPDSGEKSVSLFMGESRQVKRSKG
jgi:hypothetical protein